MQCSVYNPVLCAVVLVVSDVHLFPMSDTYFCPRFRQTLYDSGSLTKLTDLKSTLNPEIQSDLVMRAQFLADLMGPLYANPACLITAECALQTNRLSVSLYSIIKYKYINISAFKKKKTTWL